MDQVLQKRIKKEIVFFVLAVIGCTLFFMGMSAIMKQEFVLARYIESMVVIVLVCYLVRFVFIVMSKIR